MKNYYLLSLLFLLANILVKSQVVLKYDEAGNQIYRGLDANKNAPNTQPDKTPPEAPSSLAITIANKIKVAPVPVRTDLNVFWDQSIKDYIIKIELLPYNAFRIIESVNVANLKTNSYIFGMSHLPYGVYYLKFYLNDKSTHSVTVTKY